VVAEVCLRYAQRVACQTIRATHDQIRQVALQTNHISSGRPGRNPFFTQPFTNFVMLRAPARVTGDATDSVDLVEA
jgi:hypothetical protein